MTFASRLFPLLRERGPLCVGIDPHVPLLERWGLSVDGAGVREFGIRVVEAAAGRVAVVKPQVAFFERFGAAGFAALEDTIRAARAAGLLVVADGKRGDIGSTVDAYGDAWLEPGSPLEADAMTAYAYQGLGSLDGVLDRAAAWGKGVIVVTAASNPEAAETQGARRADGRTVARALVDDLRALGGTGGAVLGATVDLAATGIDLDALDGLPILAPGYGAQGATAADLPRVFGPAAPQVMASYSRSILGAGPDGIADAVERTQDELRESLR
jgi:orotidine 5''-phosphate decarboxylase, subfamily 2